MPITKNIGIYYSMPQEIKKYLDFDFCKTFLQELHMIDGISLSDFCWDSIGYLEGTGAWFEAFSSTCRKFDYHELLCYYCKLPWYDSDLFDSELSDTLVAYKLIFEKTECDILAIQLDIDDSYIAYCNECGKLFHKKDVIVNNEDECLSKYTCQKCANNKEVNELKINIPNALNEILGLHEKDYFLCEKCGNYHYVYNKGEKYCKNCEIQEKSEYKNANNYYRDNLNLNEQYLRTYLPKKRDFEGFDYEIIFDTNKKLFVGKILEKEDNPYLLDTYCFENESCDKVQETIKKHIKAKKK